MRILRYLSNFYSINACCSSWNNDGSLLAIPDGQCTCQYCFLDILIATAVSIVSRESWAILSSTTPKDGQDVTQISWNSSGTAIATVTMYHDDTILFVVPYKDGFVLPGYKISCLLMVTNLAKN